MSSPHDEQLLRHLEHAINYERARNQMNIYLVQGKPARMDDAQWQSRKQIMQLGIHVLTALRDEHLKSAKELLTTFTTEPDGF